MECEESGGSNSGFPSRRSIIIAGNALDPVTVVGVPTDANSSFARGAALAPPIIREALHSPSTNLCTENGIDLDVHRGWEYA